MNKQLIALPIIAALLIAGGAFYLANSSQELEAAIPISNDFSFFDWAKCYTNLNITNDCTNSESYNYAASRFANLTNIQSDNIIPPCKNFTNYFLNATADQSLNQNSYFTNCFFNTEVLSIAQSDQCFYDYYFAPIYLNCTQTTFEAQLKTISNDRDVSFTGLGGCQYNFTSNHIEDPCQQTQPYWTTSAQFNALTYPDAGNTLSAACQNYYDYRGFSEADQPINYKNYYHDCFITEKIQEIVNSNYCFYKNYYYPLYVHCAGF